MADSTSAQAIRARLAIGHAGWACRFCGQPCSIPLHPAGPAMGIVGLRIRRLPVLSAVVASLTAVLVASLLSRQFADSKIDACEARSTTCRRVFACSTATSAWSFAITATCKCTISPPTSSHPAVRYTACLNTGSGTGPFHAIQLRTGASYRSHGRGQYNQH